MEIVSHILRQRKNQERTKELVSYVDFSAES